jgi:hypothetical protein
VLDQLQVSVYSAVVVTLTHNRRSVSPATVNVLVTLKESFDMIDWGMDMNEKETIVKVTKAKTEQQKLASKRQTTV